MANPIFRSQYTAAQIESLIGHGVPIVQNGTWWTWNVNTSAYVDTGASAEGAEAWHGIADEFDATASYAAGDLVIYNGELYVCTTAHTGAWDAADFAATTVAAQLKIFEDDKSIALGAYPHATVSGAVAYFMDGADGIPVRSLTAQIAPVQAAGTPTPESPLPISGWTKATIPATGSNILDPSTSEVGYIRADGSINIVTPVNYGVHSALIPVHAGDNLLLTGFYNYPTTDYFRIHGYDSNGNWVEQLSFGTANDQQPNVRVTATVPDDIYYAKISYTTLAKRMMLVFGSEDLPYAPFVGKTVSVNWQTEAGTVYGGTITYLGNKLWQLLPTKAGVDLGTLSWTAQSMSGNRTAFYVPQSSLPAAPLYPQFSSDVPDALSSIATPTYQTASSWGVNSFLFTASAGVLPANALAYIFDANQFADADDFRAAVTGQTLVYALATPAAPISLTADDVLSLLGDTNVWADCGDVSVDYRADTTLYIDGKVNAIMAAIAEL